MNDSNEISCTCITPLEVVSVPVRMGRLSPAGHHLGQKVTQTNHVRAATVFPSKVLWEARARQAVHLPKSEAKAGGWVIKVLYPAS